MTTPSTEAIEFSMTKTEWQSLTKTGDEHKYRYGYAAIISGPSGQGGAARLAARGALRIGAGVVSVVCDQDSIKEHTSQLNAIMVKPYGNHTDFFDRMKEITPQAICVGPNLGLGSSSQQVLSQCLALGVPMCIDADAITLMAKAPDNFPSISNPQTILTPHEGELRRFIPETFGTTSCRLSLAQSAANKAGCVVLFKGPQTIIAAPRKPPIIVSSNAFDHSGWLATAGSGDVLAGFITGLLARGFLAFDAAAIAADLHFRCAEAFGPGLIAEDIPEALPGVLRQGLSPPNTSVA